MYMKTPKMFGRPMKKVKEYPRFVLFIDEKTGIRECFQYWDLTHEYKYVDSREVVMKYNNNGELMMVDETKAVLPYKPTPLVRNKHNKVMSDKRIDNLIKNMFSDLV